MATGTEKGGESLVSIFGKHAANLEAIIEAENGVRWKEEILADLRDRLAAADDKRNVRHESLVARTEYVKTCCRNLVRQFLAERTGLFCRATAGDRQAAEDLLMLHWRYIEQSIRRAGLEDRDAEVLSRVAKGFVRAVTSERVKFRSESAEVIPALLRVICARAIATTLFESRSERGARRIPIDELHLSNPSEAASEEERLASEALLEHAMGASLCFEVEGRPSGPCENCGQEAAIEPGEAEDLILDYVARTDASGLEAISKVLSAILERMPRNHRRAIVARADHPTWSGRQLAESLGGGVSPGLVRVWLKRGRDHMRAKVEEWLRSLRFEDVTDGIEAASLRRLCRKLGIVAEPTV